jgi:hypothetical protein
VKLWKPGNSGWQVDQHFTCNYYATNERLTITSSNGINERWNVKQVTDSLLILENNGRKSTWYTCRQTGEWPSEIRLNAIGCN